jgi:hypothetical protein
MIGKIQLSILNQKKMKKIIIIFSIAFAWTNVIAQDVSINVIQSPANLPVNSNGQIQVDVCNNSAEETSLLPAHTIVASITVSTHVGITGVTGLPAGWSICTNNAQAISISNGSDASLEPGRCRTFFIDVKAGTTTDTGTEITAAIAFAGGTDATKCETSGGAPARDVALNNSSRSSVTVSSALPVKLVNFLAQKESGTARLTWTTASEVNSDMFEVQQSQDAKQWSSIGEVKAFNEGSMLRDYSFTHNTPSLGVNYYRLKMIDKDGTFAMSTVKTVNFENVFTVGVYPNPVSSTLVVDATDWSVVKKVEMVSTKGNVVYQSGAVPSAKIDVNNFSPGVYVVKVTKKDGSSQNIKAIISR